jgi:hypothetical protein
VDKTALAKVIQAIGQMALDHPEIAEIDVNPLMVDGDRPVAADALVILSSEPPAEPVRSSFVPNLKALIGPRSMAVVGASGDITKWGGSALRSIIDGGYTGTIYPVNPKGGDFLAHVYEHEELPASLSGRWAGTDRGCAGTVRARAFRRHRHRSRVFETGGGAEAEREIARIATEGGVLKGLTAWG